MRILLLDRDRETVERFEEMFSRKPDIDLVVEPIKNNAIELTRTQQFDCVLFDPAPKNDEMRGFIIGVRRGSAFYTPIIVMSHQVDPEEAYKAGANSFIKKPFASDDEILNKIDEIMNLREFGTQLRDESSDFPSKDGLISKSAFLQLYISSLDRADRYGEETYLTIATVNNIDQIRANHGDDIANDVCANLKKYAMRIRRLSDIAAHTAENQICLMLMRPANREEPKMAIERFTDSMSEYVELISVGEAKANVNVKMMAVPSGHITFSKDLA